MKKLNFSLKMVLNTQKNLIKCIREKFMMMTETIISVTLANCIRLYMLRASSITCKQKATNAGCCHRMGVLTYLTNWMLLWNCAMNAPQKFIRKCDNWCFLWILFICCHFSPFYMTHIKVFSCVLLKPIQNRRVVYKLLHTFSQTDTSPLKS